MADDKREAGGQNRTQTDIDKNNIRRETAEQQQQAGSGASAGQQGSRPANNEERHGQKLDEGKNADGQPAGDTGVFGSQAPFGGGPRK